MTFDLLRLYGVELLGRAWSDRRATLERLELAGPAVADATDLRRRGDCSTPRRRSRASRASSPSASTRSTVPGAPLVPTGSSRRTGARVSVVIGGWRPESTGTVQDRLGAVLVGVPGPGGLRYLGRVGSGLAGKPGQP